MMEYVTPTMDNRRTTMERRHEFDEEVVRLGYDKDDDDVG
jgi:hypothetical protein